MNKKYLYSIELYDLYKVTVYILNNKINKKQELEELDKKLLEKIKNYFKNETTEDDINYIEMFIESNYIVYLLSKLIKRSEKIYLNTYLETCNNNPKDFLHPLKIEEPFQQLDAYDLYLYYASRKNIYNTKSKILKQ